MKWNENLNLSVFNMITEINESKALTKHISSECKCRFDGRKCNSDQWWNNNKCCCECKKRHVTEKNNVWNPATCYCENGKYLPLWMIHQLCHEIIESFNKDVKKLNNKAKTILANFNENKATCKM